MVVRVILQLPLLVVAAVREMSHMVDSEGVQPGVLLLNRAPPLVSAVRLQEVLVVSLALGMALTAATS